MRGCVGGEGACGRMAPVAVTVLLCVAACGDGAAVSDARLDAPIVADAAIRDGGAPDAIPSPDVAPPDATPTDTLSPDACPSEICDGVDDGDCDGLIDNGAICPASVDVCHEGACISPCIEAEFPCPTGYTCTVLPEGNYCVPNA